MNMTIRVFWGSRSEDPARSAERLWNFLRKLQELIGGETINWYTAEGGALPVERDAIAAHLLEDNQESDAPDIGYTTVLDARRPDGLKLQISSTVGGVAEYTGNRVVLGVRSPAPSFSADLAGFASRTLVAMAEEWEPDWGDVSDVASRTAVQESSGVRRSHPISGYAVYLSAGRSALIPPDCPAERIATGDGGTVLLPTAGGGGDLAELEAVVDLDARLRDAGAMEKLPLPMDRARF